MRINELNKKAYEIIMKKEQDYEKLLEIPKTIIMHLAFIMKGLIVEDPPYHEHDLTLFKMRAAEVYRLSIIHDVVGMGGDIKDLKTCNLNKVLELLEEHKREGLRKEVIVDMIAVRISFVLTCDDLELWHLVELLSTIMVYVELEPDCYIKQTIASYTNTVDEEISIDELNGAIKPLDWELRQYISDGYHTFGELYYHRMILFLTVMKAYENRAWKSKLHHDGTMYDDMFIVGVKTPMGQYTYHYEMKFWDEFTGIQELERAPEWDGHQPDDIIRLISLGDMTPAQDFRQWVVDHFFVIEEDILKNIKKWEDENQIKCGDEVDRALLVETISDSLIDGLLGVIETYETYGELRD